MKTEKQLQCITLAINYIEKIFEDIDNICMLAIDVHSKSYDAFYDLRQRLYETYFKNMEGYQVYPGVRY